MGTSEGGTGFGHGLCQDPPPASEQIACHVILEKIQCVVRTLL
jgi:hypothetical protein